MKYEKGRKRINKMDIKKLKKGLILLVVLISILFVWDGKASAIPTLQLDILGGTYDSTTETIIASGSSFTLYAYLIPNGSNTLADSYYISAALVPQINSHTNLGSFTFNGDTINVTGGMVYGVPPLETIVALQGWDSGDLPRHGIFQTYFREFEFRFLSSNRASQYNTEDNTGIGPILNPSGTMYFAMFVVDTSLLAGGYAIHFDLYNTIIRRSGDIDVTQFAPFSHDAQSRQVPEPSILLLIGAGLIGLGVWGRKFKQSP